MRIVANEMDGVGIGAVQKAERNEWPLGAAAEVRHGE